MEQKIDFGRTTFNSALTDGIILSVIWLLVFWLFTALGKDDYYLIWIIDVLPFIPLYTYFSTKAIPDLLGKGEGYWRYFSRYIVSGSCINVALISIYCLMFRAQTPFVWMLLYLIFFLLAFFMVAPATWIVYSNRQSVYKLKTDLGKSTADLGFLRSQINPHFLFNVLNTLYGTALQEEAPRTSEGIQKLGDMMRFMLQENMQDKIPLTREVEYLTNYVELQKLRVQTSPDIVIELNIEEQHNYLLIAPMLLIPFVENAFKHGISLQEPSYIKISLHTEGNKLYFDVYNGTHAKKENDPESNNHGIGLDNVAQRLNLLYAGEHELVIHESMKEFFVHLVINLTGEIAIIE
ncbi:sensor histidine kinase [Mucilaginibacter ximonensis]|uniref:Sensor histidine kinase n=1 Tax=Mucilaginibacter ximonensis TaxID=538021 RepID=A0ABW5YGQ7_9SPHI